MRTRRARYVTPPRASYTYLQLAVPHRLKNNYLVLRLTGDELAQIEIITRQQPLGAWVYLWRDGHWLEFPCGSHADYRLVSALLYRRRKVFQQFLNCLI